MTTGEHDVAENTNTADANTETAAPATEETTPPKRKLELEVEMTSVGPCKKHIKIAVARAEIDRQFQESLGEMRKEAFIPGFRPGHAPRQLVEKRYRKEVANQVKSTLLLGALEQIDEDHKLNPITQPDLDVASIELPEEGPMRFEIDVEVRPDFELPNYKGLTVKRPVKAINEADVDAQFKRFVERYAQLVPKLEGGAVLGDFITADLRFHHEGETLNEAKEIQFRLQPELRFQDGSVPRVGEVLEGVAPNEARDAEATIGSSSPDPNLRGKTIQVTFQVNDLKTLRLPEVNAAFLGSVGFENEEDLRVALKGVLERRFQGQQRQAIRRSLMDQLIESTPFTLPAELVSRQEKSTLRRLVSQLREEGASDNEIRAREAELRANAHDATLRSLKEFFLLAKIADAEGIKVEDDDIDREIELIALRSNESPRRVRARVEKEGLADAIASDVLERRVIDRVLESATYEDIELEATKEVETLDSSVSNEVPETTETPESADPEAGAGES